MAEHVLMESEFADGDFTKQFADAGKRYQYAQFMLNLIAEKASRYPDDTINLQMVDDALAEVARRRAIQEGCARRYEKWKKDHTL